MNGNLIKGFIATVSIEKKCYFLCFLNITLTNIFSFLMLELLCIMNHSLDDCQGFITKQVIVPLQR